MTPEPRSFAPMRAERPTYVDHLEAQLRAFIRAIDHGKDPTTGREHAYREMVLEGCAESAKLLLREAD